MSIEKGLKASKQSIADFGIKDATVHWNLKSTTLAEISVDKEMGIFSNTGA